MTLGILGNLNKPSAAEAIASLVEILRRRSIPYILHDALLGAHPALDGLGPFVSRSELRDRSDVVIAFGGDGTMLSAGRFLAGSGVPLLGVNLGKLGFLAEFPLAGLEETVDDLLNGRCRNVERTLVEATFPDDPGLPPLVGLNDIVIDKRDGSLMLRLQAVINNDYLGTYIADGLIVATPTGSTAYALAVGGPVISPAAHVLVIAPIAPHMLTARPVVIPDTAAIEIRATAHGHQETVRVFADGQEERQVPMGHIVLIRKLEHSLYLVKRVSQTYFDVLRAKLLWGREPVLETPQHSSD